MGIEALAPNHVSRLVSGQVITDLVSAVKELIENALDARATNIEVRFKESGLESFEVQDNGIGIAQDDHANVALRGHTSKLSSFDGLAEVSTFGFRGEALASLCNLAKVSLTTATEADAPMGYALTFDTRGAVKTTSREARTRGTTVSVSKLLVAVPVRRKDFERNIKKHFKQVGDLVQSYALISQGVRISLINTEKGLFNSSGQSTAATFSALFGAKHFATLMPLDLSFEVEPEKMVLRHTEGKATATKVVVKGYISKPVAGQGRPSSDRQFFYVNGRPFNPSTKLPRAFNEVYRSFNANQTPCIIADFQVATDAYDVNLSPDKRTILLHSEANLLEQLKVSLEEAFVPFRSTFSTQAPVSKKDIGLSQPLQPFTSSSLPRPAPRPPSPASDEIDEDSPAPAPKPKPVMISLEPRQLMLDTSGASWSLKEGAETGPPHKKRKVGTDPSNKRAAFSNVVSGFHLGGTQTQLELKPTDDEEQEEEGDEEDELVEVQRPELRNGESDSEEEGEARPPDPQPRPLFRHASSEEDALTPVTAEPLDLELDLIEEHVEVPHMPPSSPSQEKEPPDLRHSSSHDGLDAEAHLQELEQEGVTGSTVTYDKTVYEPVFSRSIACDVAEIEAAWAQPAGAASRMAQDDKEPIVEVQMAGLSVDDEEAEAALSRIVSQDDFATMDVVGQFNLGFIVARGKRDGHDDLWILDQHASDEKRNFEELQASTRMESQRQLQPRPLSLPAADELLVLDSLDILKANGFEVTIDDDAAPGSRVSLVTHPVSKTTVFGISDLEELIHLLHEAAPGQLVRPAKVRAMFAMRACRMSVMVGRHLTQPQMTGIIRRMQTMESPWACPHGRPTMRWLASVKPNSFAHVEDIDWSLLE